jgi:hypothetical protein
MSGTNPASWIEEVSADEAMGHTAEIARWVRLSGTDDERKAFDYINGVLEGFGLKTWFHEPTCLVSLPLAGSLVVDDENLVPCITHSFSISTPEAGLVGELVYAGGGTEQELAAVNVRGKIVLTEGLAAPQKAHAATRAGAIGVVSISGDNLHEMIVSPVWGSPTPRTLAMMPQVVMVSITSEAGARLKERLQHGRARARIGARVDTSWRPIPVLVADLDTDGRDYVLFSGHVDSWHYGAMDNASANATMIETARILSGHRGELRRGVRFAFWSGHSHARYASSTWFADRYWFDLRERCVAHVNVDSTGAVGATILEDANTMAESYPLAREVIGRQVDQQLEYRRFGRAGDQSFWGVGLSSFFMSLSHQAEASEVSAHQARLLGGRSQRSGGLGWWWHTTEDTLDKIDPSHLARDIRVYVEVVGRLTTEAIVPLDVRAALDEIASTLDEIEPLWAGLPTGGADDESGISALRDELEQARVVADQLATLQATSGLSADQQAHVSRAIVRACKALVPVNYTASGEFEHDPALGAVPLPGLRPPKAPIEMTEDELWGATHLYRRAINRVRAGVKAAREEMQSATN